MQIILCRRRRSASGKRAILLVQGTGPNKTSDPTRLIHKDVELRRCDQKSSGRYAQNLHQALSTRRSIC